MLAHVYVTSCCPYFAASELQGSDSDGDLTFDSDRSNSSTGSSQIGIPPATQTSLPTNPRYKFRERSHRNYKEMNGIIRYFAMMWYVNFLLSSGGSDESGSESPLDVDTSRGRRKRRRKIRGRGNVRGGKVLRSLCVFHSEPRTCIAAVERKRGRKEAKLYKQSRAETNTDRVRGMNNPTSPMAVNVLLITPLFCMHAQAAKVGDTLWSISFA